MDPLNFSGQAFQDVGQDETETDHNGESEPFTWDPTRDPMLLSTMPSLFFPLDFQLYNQGVGVTGNLPYSDVFDGSPWAIDGFSSLGFFGPSLPQPVPAFSTELDYANNGNPSLFPDLCSSTPDSKASSTPPCEEGLSIEQYKGPQRRARSGPTRLPQRHVDVLSKNDPKIIEKRGKSGGRYTIQVFGGKERVRSSMCAASRAATTITRAVGACPRCRKLKLRCNMPEDPVLPCERCSSISGRSLKQPCLRVSILNLKLHRKGSTLDDKLGTWVFQHQQKLLESGKEQETPVVVTVTQNQGISFQISISKFDIQPGDITGYTWYDGTTQRCMEMPPYLICDVEEAARNMIDATTRGQDESISFLLQDANPIQRKTIEAAKSYSRKSTLVSNVLTFWVATRFIENLWRISEGELPGFEPSFEDHPWKGYVPVTPVMDTQIDDIALRHFLLPLGEKILKELHQKIMARRRESWFEIYLTMFIIMNNFERHFSDVIEWTSGRGIKASSNAADSLGKAYWHTCRTLLVYFRFACQGQSPLSLPLHGSHEQNDGLTSDQIEYIRDMKQEVTAHSVELETWKGGSIYRTPMYLCYRVISDDWSPELDLSEALDNFTEQDLLTS